MSAHRRDEITAAVAAYNAAADRRGRVTPTAVRLLIVMFPSGDICQRSLESLAQEGFDREYLGKLLRRLEAAGFVSKERGSGHLPNLYRLHLPPLVQP